MSVSISSSSASSLFGRVSCPARFGSAPRANAAPTPDDAFTPGANSGNAKPSARRGVFGSTREGFRALSGALKDRTNRLLLTGFGLQLGLPALLGLSLLAGPVGWLLAIVATPLTIAGNWYGEKLTARAFEEIDARGLSKGRPLDRLAKMNDIWYNTTPESAGTFRQHYNRLIKDIFGDAPEPRAAGAPPRSLGDVMKTSSRSVADRLRRGLTLHPRSKLGATLDAALTVKSQYQAKLYSRIANTLTEWCHRLPGMKPVALALSIAFHSTFLLFNHRKIAQAMAHHVRRAF
ncbi:MAG: hypothetical protein IPK79_11255 [Vampirovibrionales bacterium]|nr:hypothetical protein [Vampirovibrionales bacterium]